MTNLFFSFICAVLFFNSAHATLSQDKNNESRKKALIFGVSGQDGTYLSEFLLNKNYEVHGVARHISLPESASVKQQTEGNPRYIFHAGDVTNFSTLIHLIGTIQPDEIYNLAAQSRVKTSFDLPEDTAEINALGTLRILESIKMLGLEKKVRFFQASSSELFGLTEGSPLTEKTPFHPHSPYGASKLYGYWITVNYRESYGIFACNGILFNHESPIRGESFVTRKITLAACRYKLGLQDILYLGNLDAKRDWGFAKDYIRAMWKMLQQNQPDDYIIATGEQHSVREFIELAYKHLDIEVEWHGEGVNEYAVNKANGKTIVKIDPAFYRPNEVDFPPANPEKAEKILKWKAKTNFTKLVQIMMNADYKKVLNKKGL